MFRFLPVWLVAPVMLVLFLAMLAFWFTLTLPGVILHCLPLYRLQRVSARYCVAVARGWVASNRIMLRLLLPIRWQIAVEGELDINKSYLLVSNHRSWADILVLFDVFHGRVPFPRFFLKRDLMFVPLVGQICWAMDFPFMTRKSGSTDLETTRRACEIYRTQPVTVVNFLEGTRFTPAKQAATASPFLHLLKPKAGGVAYTLGAMGDQFAGVIDVTLRYQKPSLPLAFSWLGGEQTTMHIDAKVLPVPQELLAGNYAEDPQHRARVQAWVTGLWQEKDKALAAE